MILRLMCIISLIILHLMKNLNAKDMNEVFKWKQIDYYNRGDDYPTTGPSSAAIYFPGPTNYNMESAHHNLQNNMSSYIPYNNVPMGATHYNGRLFVTVPRRRVGIPSTLNYINLKRESVQNPKLIAYPDFETNQLTSNSKRIISVYRTSTDNCGRLWFIDTGMLEYPNNFTQIQRPTIWLIDLRTDEEVRRFEIPLSVVAEGRGLASITPDTDIGCDKAFAYIPDLVANRLYVYSLEHNKIWTFNHNYFHFDPIAGDLEIGGQSFRWNDGIFSVSLGRTNADHSREIYFHAMASNNEFAVNNKVLQNETNALRSYHGEDFWLLGSRGDKKQSTMHKYDPITDVVFYAEIQRSGVGCWNTKKPFTSANHGQVTRNDQTMIYPSDLTIDEEGNMWVMTNSMPIFIYSTLDVNTFNFRVWKLSTKQAIKNTVCT